MRWLVAEWWSGRAQLRWARSTGWALIAAAVLVGLLGWSWGQLWLIGAWWLVFGPRAVRDALGALRGLAHGRVSWTTVSVVAVVAFGVVVARSWSDTARVVAGVVGGVVMLVVVPGLWRVGRVAAEERARRDREEEDLRQVLVGALVEPDVSRVMDRARDRHVVVGAAAGLSLASELRRALPEACGAQPDGEFVLDRGGHIVAASDPRVHPGSLAVCFRPRLHRGGHSWEVDRSCDEGPQPWPS